MVAQATLKQSTLNPSTHEPAMFSNSMLEVSWPQRSRRSLTTLSSFGLEAVIIGLLLLVPLLKTIGLPGVRTVSTPISAGRRDVRPLTGRPHVAAASATTTAAPVPFLQPGHIPRFVAAGPDDSSTLPPGGSTACAGCTNIGVPNGPPNLFSNDSSAALPPPPAPAPTRVFRTSSILQGMLIHSVQPAYPPLSRTARIQGTVVLSAVISKAGTISDVHVLRGHPLLVAAAVDAVSQWRYRPYILNNEAIEVDTQITVNFSLGGN